MKPVVLIVDDEERMRGILEIAVSSWGYKTLTASNGKEALEISEEENVDIIITDLNMPEMEGTELLIEVKKKLPYVQVIIMTAYGTIKSAIKAMKDGAFDYILKPFDNEEVKLILQKALSYSQLEKENLYLKGELKIKYDFTNIIGISSKMQEVFDLIKKVSTKNVTVLITGENGTGKELVARAIHYNSNRKEHPFISVNCAALNENLLESELFGHEKGSFTGAVRAKRGKFEDASEGTLFLDEISETSQNFQAKLLRVLQEKEFYRVGGNEKIKVDVRVLAATNKNLVELVEQGEFREDLYYRLKVIPIHLPPLRERPEDIEVLVRHFVTVSCKDNDLPEKAINQNAIYYLKSLEWKGNVRELKNAVERAVVLSTSDILEKDDFLFLAEGSVASEVAVKDPSLKSFIDRQTKKYIIKILNDKDWVKQDAAEVLDIDRTTLFRMMKKYDIDQK